MTLPKTRASITDCRQFADAVTKAGGSVPEPLTNILDGYNTLASLSAPQDPLRAIVAAATNGELTPSKRDSLIAEAALHQTRASYLGELRQRIEAPLVREFHQVLGDGAADEILDSLRPRFDAAAQQIAAAKALGISAESTSDHILASGEPGLVEAWQQLDQHIAVVNTIAAVASQFGCRLAKFPLIEEYANSDNYQLEDRAICATNGSLVGDSALFRRPDQGHRTSPWFRTTLKLHTVDSARDRYRVWAAAQWEQQHSGPVQSWLDEQGKAHPMERPINPYLAGGSVLQSVATE